MFIENRTKAVLTTLDKRISALSKAVKIQYPLPDIGPACPTTARICWRKIRSWIADVDRAIGSSDFDEAGSVSGVIGLFSKYAKVNSFLVSDAIPNINSHIFERCKSGHIHLVKPSSPADSQRMYDDPLAYWPSMKIAATDAYKIITTDAYRLIDAASSSMHEALTQFSRETGVPVEQFREELNLRTRCPKDCSVETASELIKKKEAARILDISERTLDRKVAERLIERIKLGNGKKSAVRFRREDILAMK